MKSLWKGSISFGLVSIPIKLQLGSQGRDLDILVSHDGCHIIKNDTIIFTSRIHLIGKTIS